MISMISGAKTGTYDYSQNRATSDKTLFFLDNMGCNGSESNLLDCLPQHNCNSMMEIAGVECLRRGKINNGRI